MDPVGQYHIKTAAQHKERNLNAPFMFFYFELKVRKTDANHCNSAHLSITEKWMFKMNELRLHWI